jgi:hypothetical protein
MPGWYVGWFADPSKKYSQSEPLESIQALKLLSDPTQDQLQYLGQMPNLTTIDMSNINLSRLDFSCLTKVQELNLRATEGRTTPDLSSLVRLPHLHTLKLTPLREEKHDDEKNKANALALAGLSHVNIIRADILSDILFTADDVIQQADACCSTNSPKPTGHLEYIGFLKSLQGRTIIKELTAGYNAGRAEVIALLDTLGRIDRTDPNGPYNKRLIALTAFKYRDEPLLFTALTVPTPTPVASLYDLTKGIAPQKVGVILQGISQNGAASPDVRIQADFARARLKYEDPKTYSALTDDETYALFTHISQNAAAQPDLRAQADFYRATMNLEGRVNTLNLQDVCYLLLEIRNSTDKSPELGAKTGDALDKALQKLAPKPSPNPASSGGTGGAPNPPGGGSSSGKVKPERKDHKKHKKKS